jgi:hypothetical protein
MSRAQVLMLAPGHGDVVYFAHSKLDYETSRAAKVRSLIRHARPGKRLLDPSRMRETWTQLVERLGSIEAVYELVTSCVHEVVALEHKGFVGRGVFLELEQAAHRGLPRYVVRGQQLVPVEGIELFDPDDYKRSYGRVWAKGEVGNVAA